MSQSHCSSQKAIRKTSKTIEKSNRQQGNGVYMHSLARNYYCVVGKINCKGGSWSAFSLSKLISDKKQAIPSAF
jgi:hypothetical protein